MKSDIAITITKSNPNRIPVHICLKVLSVNAQIPLSIIHIQLHIPRKLFKTSNSKLKVDLLDEIIGIYPAM